MKFTINVLKTDKKKVEANQDDLNMKIKLLNLDKENLNKEIEKMKNTFKVEQSGNLAKIEQMNCDNNVLKIENDKKKKESKETDLPETISQNEKYT